MSSRRKIVLATGIFYPEIGGPAIHTRKIAESLAAKNWEVVVITYGDDAITHNFPFVVRRVPRSLSRSLRWFLYFISVMKASIGAKIIYAFDLTAAGMPAFATAKLLGKKFVIRIAGDPIWERIVEKNKRFLSIKEYYQKNLYNVDKPKLFKAIKYIIRHTDILVTYSPFLRNLYTKYYGIPSEKFHIIRNPIFKQDTANNTVSQETTVLFAGRFVSYKNLKLLIRVFDILRQRHNYGKLILIGHGPERKELEKLVKNIPSKEYITIHSAVEQETLFTYIRSATVCIGPALTEFNPNFILESLSFGRPTLISRENGLSVQLPEEFLFDAKNDKEFTEKLDKFFDKQFCEKALKTVSQLPMNQTWEKVINAHLELLSRF